MILKVQVQLKSSKNTCHFSFVVYRTRSRNVIAANGGDLERILKIKLNPCPHT
jgi:hypothetical protein